MKLFGFLLLCCCLMGALKAQAQTPTFPKTGKNDTIKTYVTVLDGEMVPWIVTEDVNIVDSRIFKSEADRKAFNLLRYNVTKVIPYAHFAGSRYRQLQRDLALTGDKEKQKVLIKACESQIKDMFKKEIQNLTISQGEILIKLINRETDNTTYSMVKELKGGFNAFLLQSAARIFGHNLKETYDRDEQRDIEQILQQAGYDSYRN
ncbi:MAG: hypothetical protein JWP71_297 [Mucilaginibacter sp.]|nr:hypothetical protein [Mucilaginibacter sp.]